MVFFLEVAERQGRYVAQVLNIEASGEKYQKPFEFQSMGMMAYIGGSRALSDLPAVKLKGMHLINFLPFLSFLMGQYGLARLKIQKSELGP